MRLVLGLVVEVVNWDGDGVDRVQVRRVYISSCQMPSAAGRRPDLQDDR